MGVLTRLSGNLGGMGHNQNIVLNFPAFRVQMQGNNIQTVQIRLNEEGNSSRGHNMLIGNNLPFDMDRETVGETGNQGTSQIGPFLLNQGTTESQPRIVSNAEAPAIIRLAIKHTYVRKLKKKQEQPNHINVFQAPPTSSKVGTKHRRTQDGQPDVESSIRRSERLKAKSQGFKNRTVIDGPVSKNTRSAKKKVPAQKELADNLFLPQSISHIDFPGLKQLENVDDFPAIPIIQLQEVAVQKCGLSPSEVTAELLLARTCKDGSTEDGKRSSKKALQTVING